MKVETKKCIGYPGCDGMLVGEEHEAKCPLAGTFGPPPVADLAAENRRLREALQDLVGIEKCVWAGMERRKAKNDAMKKAEAALSGEPVQVSKDLNAIILDAVDRCSPSTDGERFCLYSVIESAIKKAVSGGAINLKFEGADRLPVIHGLGKVIELRAALEKLAGE